MTDPIECIHRYLQSMSHNLPNFITMVYSVKLVCPHVYVGMSGLVGLEQIISVKITCCWGGVDAYEKGFSIKQEDLTDSNVDTIIGILEEDIKAKVLDMFVWFYQDSKKKLTSCIAQARERVRNENYMLLNAEQFYES